MTLGMIEVEVYRGARAKPGNTLNIVRFDEPKWLDSIKTEVERSCQRIKKF
jgi:hypothetical protein